MPRQVENCERGEGGVEVREVVRMELIKPGPIGHKAYRAYNYNYSGPVLANNRLDYLDNAKQRISCHQNTKSRLILGLVE